jgi:hypothetical protein
VPPVCEHDLDAGVEEGELAQPVLQRLEVELHHGEGVGGGEERHLGAALPARGSGDLQRSLRHAVAKLHHVLVAALPDPQLQVGRERVDHRDADAVQAARDLVGVLVELAAGMQLRHHDLGRRALRIVVVILLDRRGDAAAIVRHGHGAVLVQRDGDLRGVAGQRLVDGVVHHLVDHVVQARPVVGVADVHARPLAHGVEASGP